MATWCLFYFLSIVCLSEANILLESSETSQNKHSIIIRSVSETAYNNKSISYHGEDGLQTHGNESDDPALGNHGNSYQGDDDSQTHGNESEGTAHGSHGIHVASWNYDYVEEPFIIATFLLVAGVFKLGFHHADFLSSIVPESCLLIILGVLVGFILHLSEEDNVFPVYLTPRLFFLFLLPPIILESAYSLHDRVFFDNIGTVLLFAVIGTILNCFTIGLMLCLLADIGAMGEIEITLVQCLVFSSLVVAVDPVAVLAIFQEIGVNNVLYFLVFGESLLNDAVTVVLYNTMKNFNLMDDIPFSQIILGICAFFTVSLGGLFVGLLFGILTAILTKYTVNVRVVEPLAIFVLAYMSYLVAEMFHFSGIISIIGCGITQANYAFHNVSQKTNSTVKYFIKMLSATCDCVIFLFLGMTLFRSQLIWHTGFVLWTLLLCLVVRFLVVFLLTFVANKLNRLKKIDLEEQFIMAYGGLRGAVCFSLVDMLEPGNLVHRDMFVTTSLTVVFFTVFVQGISIKPLVKFLRIRLKEQQVNGIYEEINDHVTDHVMAGVEEILGRKGQYYWREILEYYDDKYLKNIFQREPSKTDERIMEMYEKILLRQIKMWHQNPCWKLSDAAVRRVVQRCGAPVAKLILTVLPNAEIVEACAPISQLIPRRFVGWQHFENLSSSKFPEQYDSTLFLFNEEGGDRETSPFGQLPHLGKSCESETLTEDEMEQYEKAQEEGRRKSRAASIIPSIKAADRRRESRGLIRQETLAGIALGLDDVPDNKTLSAKVISNPTVGDIRKMLAKNPLQLLHQEKGDKNLKRDENSDIMHLLHKKQAQTRRMSINIGGNYDGIFQGALIQSRLRDAAAWKSSQNRMTSFQETSPAPKRNRSYSSFTPEEAEQVKKLSKKRSDFTRSATVGYDQSPGDYDAQHSKSPLQTSRKKLSGSLESQSESAGSSSNRSIDGSDESVAKSRQGKPRRDKERAVKWRIGRMKKVPTFDVGEPLPVLEEAQPGTFEEINSIDIMSDESRQQTETTQAPSNRVKIRDEDEKSGTTGPTDHVMDIRETESPEKRDTLANESTEAAHAPTNIDRITDGDEKSGIRDWTDHLVDIGEAETPEEGDTSRNEPPEAAQALPNRDRITDGDEKSGTRDSTDQVDIGETEKESDMSREESYLSAIKSTDKHDG